MCGASPGLVSAVWCRAAQPTATSAVCVSAVQMLGVPTPEVWPGYADLPHRIDFKPAAGQPLQQVFQQVGDEQDLAWKHTPCLLSAHAAAVLAEASAVSFSFTGELLRPVDARLSGPFAAAFPAALSSCLFLVWCLAPTALRASAACASAASAAAVLTGIPRGSGPSQAPDGL